MDRQNMDKLIGNASKQLNTSPDSLKKQIENGEIMELSKRLSKSDKQMLRTILSNQELMKKLNSASNPEDIIRILSGK